MKNSVFIVIISLLLYSCGSAKKVRTTSQKKDPRKETKTEQVVVIEKPEVKQEKNEELEATSTVSTTATTVHNYINQFKEVAKGNMKDYKIPASITLAQGILESGAGKGRLCLEANNHFGIKCHTGWTGPSITHDDDVLQECFRKYNDPADSYKDHSKFLTSRSRYNDLFKLDILDYKGWANGLKKAGYATDPKYPSKLIGIIERYQLFLYDHEVVAPRSIKNKVEQVIEEVEVFESKTSVNEALYVVQKGDTLYSLSKRFNTTVEKLKEVNNLKDNSLSIGQEIRVQ